MDKEERDFRDVQRGIAYEKEGDIENAIKMYERLVSHKFDGSHPYDRLCIIYRKRQDFSAEERVLQKAISVFSKIVDEGHRDDGLPKLTRYQKRLSSLHEKQIKTKLNS